jgi:hypothetical protein
VSHHHAAHPRRNTLHDLAGKTSFEEKRIWSNSKSFKILNRTWLGICKSFLEKEITVSMLFERCLPL